MPIRSPSRERRGADRDDHELLEVHVVVRVRPAVQDVHHRHGEHVRDRAAEVAVEREARSRRPPARAAASETARMALAPSRLLFGVPSSSIIVAVEAHLVVGVVALHARRSRRWRSRRPSDAFARQRSSPSRSSTASCSPVLAPLGTAARPAAPVRGSRRPRRWGCRASPGSPGRGSARCHSWAARNLSAEARRASSGSTFSRRASATSREQSNSPMEVEKQSRPFDIDQLMRRKIENSPGSTTSRPARPAHRRITFRAYRGPGRFSGTSPKMPFFAPGLGLLDLCPSSRGPRLRSEGLDLPVDVRVPP